MSNNDDDIFEIDDTDMEDKDEDVVEKVVIKKKQKTALSQERLDKLREQLKTAREAKQKRKNGGKEPEVVKEVVKEPVKETPKKEIKPRVVKTPKVDKNELLLKELQSLKLEISNLKKPAVAQQAPMPKQVVSQQAPKQIVAQQAPTPQAPKPVVKTPYSLFKVPVW